MQTEHDDDLNAGSIAIVGMAGRFPAARSASELWTMLSEGREAAQWMTDEELLAAGVPVADFQDPDYVRASLVLPDMEMFDAGFFGFSKRDASVLDPQHRHFLECAWEALEDAGHMPESFKGAIGVFGGCGMQAYLPYNLLTNPALVKSMGLFLLRHTGNDKDFLTTRVSYLLDLKGPSLSIQTACSTSLVAVHVASQSLLSGECDMALAGGVSIELPHRQGYHYAAGEILSPDGHCRAFDEDASGTVFGSGAGIVVLRRLADAIRDRDNIYAVIRGSAVNNDGNQKAGFLAPSVDGQARAAVEALAVSGVDAASVSYIEAHGTGTPVGDPIEFAALTQAYGGVKASCGIGSLKTNIGHLDTAAGVASLMKVSLALRHGLIPATLNFSRPNSRLEIDKTPFYVMDQAKPWARSATPRRAAVNSLGVGGTNAHVIVEEAPLQANSKDDSTWQVVTLSARTATSLDGLKAKWRDFLAQPPEGFRLSDAAYTTHVGRKAFEHRCTLVARDVAGLRTALQPRLNERCVTNRAAGGKPGVVMMFPGGGAHFPGAGRELLGQGAFKAAVEECFRLMPADAPADLRAVMFESDAADGKAAQQLERPAYAIPALFTLEYALAKLWQSWGIVPAAVIGHSAGEYTAACLAGVMSLADALSVVVLRGQLFETVPKGAMLSVDLSEADLRAQIAGLELDIAVVNGPDLCIASGTLAAITQLEEKLAAQGIECRRLRIAVAAHSRLLDGILGSFRDRLSRIRLQPPSIPFISNLTGTWVDPQTLTDPEYWVRHLRQTVRFSEGLARALEISDAALLEVGPGQGLGGIARQNKVPLQHTVLASTAKAKEAGDDLAVMLLSAGALWTLGAAPSWPMLRGGRSGNRVSLPTYAFDHERHWIEPGAGLPGQAQTRTEAAAVAEGPAIRRLASYDDWFSTPAWVAAPLEKHGVQRDRTWLVFGNHSKLTSDLLAEAASLGARVVVVHAAEAFGRLADGSFCVSPGDSAHFRQLFEALEADRQLPDTIVHLWALDTIQGRAHGAIAGQALAFDSLMQLGKAIVQQDISAPMHLTVVTAGSQAVGGEKVPHPARALALGPCRVMPREIPNMTTRLVDLSPADIASDMAAKWIVAESQVTSGPDLVAYLRGERLSLKLTRADSGQREQVSSRLRTGGAYLITGGLGDIALDLAFFLASTCRARLALVARRTLPPKSEWCKLAASSDASVTARVVRRLVACEQAGGHVMVFSADASNRQAMGKVVSDCRAHFGAINGVFHAAGLLEDAPIATKTADSIQRVLSAKAGSAQVLHELLPPGDLDVFAVFSSTSVHLAAAGQADYVAANAFVDSLAASRTDGLAIHWGIWGGQGMAARAKLQGSDHAQQEYTAHPFLGWKVGNGEGAVFEATFSPADLWSLNEHAVGGRSVLPGTAYIEIARAAMSVMHPGEPVEIRALSFEEAMVFGGGSTRLVRTELQRTRDGYDLVVRSCGVLGEAWVDHARAAVSVFRGTLPVASPLAALAAGDWRDGAIPQEHTVAFGARWRNIKRMQMLGSRHAIAEMELPDRFSGDLVDYFAHPAVTDMAATFGLHLVEAGEREGNLFVPLSIDCIRIVAPLPSHSVSRVEMLGDFRNRAVSFDVNLHAPDGSPIATFQGFSMRAVKPEAVSQQVRAGAVREQTLMEAMLSCGIRSEDSHELFNRVLSGDRRDVVVSSIALDQLKKVLAMALPAAPRQTSLRTDARVLNAPGYADFNPVERVIAEAWSELLGVQEISRDDDFFALGGHSLAAVRLFARIRKQFAVDLPLATLFQASTLAELSRVVSESGAIDTSEAAAVLKKISSTVAPLPKAAWSPLVTICKGLPGRRPLFCVHGAGGNVLNFKVISDRLGADQPFYGLQAQGVDGRLPPLATVEAMASQYVEAVRAVAPHGPYQLAGYSAGGVIALEMAQQLRKAGEDVCFLGMIDTLSPTAARAKISYFKKVLLMRHWSLQFAMDWPNRRRRNRLLKVNYAIALEKLARGEPLPAELVEFHLFNSFVAAQSRYHPQPYSGPITLFRAKQGEMQYLDAGPTLGWSDHISGAITVREIDGSHFSMMAEPGVSELIDGFRASLAVARAETAALPLLPATGNEDSRSQG